MQLNINNKKKKLKKINKNQLLTPMINNNLSVIVKII